MTETWRPILEGELADQARRAIADVIRDIPPPPACDDPSLVGGPAGLAILCHYFDRVFPGEGGAELAEQYLERAIDLAAQVRLKPRLPAGFAGIAWAVRHLESATSRDGSDEPGDDDSTDEVDQLLLRHLESATPCNGRLDYSKGIVGLGAYALERGGSPGQRICDGVVKRLAATAVVEPEGITWLTLLPFRYARLHNLEDLPPEELAHPDPDKPRYDLGVYHGVAGVVAFLARAVATGTGGASTRELLQGATRWLLSKRRGDDGFPSYSPPATSGLGRSAWCYGDPGVGITLLAAARALGDRQLEVEAHSLLITAAQRDVVASRVDDACLCHGAAGMTLLFQRAFHATGDDRFAVAARRWCEVALSFKRQGGVGGFEFWTGVWGETADVTEMRWVAIPGLLWGAAGTALSLLAAVSHIAPDWDRALLVWLPPMPRSWG